MSRLADLAFLCVTLITAQSLCMAQTPTAPAGASVSEPVLPIPTQLKKTVAFLDTSCLHDFSGEVRTLKQQLQQMPVQQQLAVLQQLTFAISRLEQVPQSHAKLNADDMTRLNRNFAPNMNDAASNVDEIAWRADALVKMTSLSQDEISKLKTESIPLLPTDHHLGTGFFVTLPDSRVNPSAAAAHQTAGFTYLVTNHHVITPGVETGQPCRLLGMQITVNRKPDSTHPIAFAETFAMPGPQSWSLSEDDSVDLAVLPFGLPSNVFDYIVVTTDLFVGDEDIKKKTVVEGDPVILSGLFIQTFSDTHRLEPIVRSGTIAMIPDGPVPTTINKKPGHLFFAEAHVFGGNSGSPIFVDTTRFSGIISGPSYRLLGVISGEVLEAADLSLNVSTSISGSVAANSDVSTVVPAAELLKILDSKKLKAEREEMLQKLPKPEGPQPPPSPKL